MLRKSPIGKGSSKATHHTGRSGKKAPIHGYGRHDSRIEKNQRHVCDAELRMIAKALEVTMEWLVGDSDEIKLR